jgi:hypothetical protein
MRAAQRSLPKPLCSVFSFSLAANIFQALFEVNRMLVGGDRLALAIAAPVAYPFSAKGAYHAR